MFELSFLTQLLRLQKKINIIRHIPTWLSAEEVQAHITALTKESYNLFFLGVNPYDGKSAGTVILNYKDTDSATRVKKRILGLDCVELDGGNVAEIEAALRRYKGERSEAALSGPRRRRVLLASSMLHGCGLNLENTTDVILVHKLQPDLRSQVIGRAQRPGRTGALRVHQLLFDNEL